MRYILDTNVVSEFRRLRPEPKVIAWLNDVDPETVYVSVVTLGELQKGIAKLADAPRRQVLQAWLDDDLFVQFEDRIVGLDAQAMLVWGKLIAALERGGKPMPVLDSLLAATALHGDFTLVTRNEADFAAANVQTLNPWR